MKKGIFTLFLLFIYYTLPAQDIKVPKDLDILWNQYFENGDLTAVTQIIEVFEWEDLFREEINSFLSENNVEEEKYRLIDLLEEIGFESNENKSELSELVNIGATSFILLRDKYYGPIIKEVAGIIQSKKSTLDQMKILGSAAWSLKSNSEQHPKVRRPPGW